LLAVTHGPATTGKAPPPAPEEVRFDALLSELKSVVERGGARTKLAPAEGFAGIGRLSVLRTSLAAEDEKARAHFSQLGNLIREKNLPAEILERHAAAVQDYETKYRALTAKLENIEAAHADATGWWGRLTNKDESVEWDRVIGEATDFLKENTPPSDKSAPHPRKSRFDPQNLPH
ncbi:MAG: hypothetical protein ACRD68_18470, partial [Pyrinomonadaceae bacterium]